MVCSYLTSTISFEKGFLCGAKDFLCAFIRGHKKVLIAAVVIVSVKHVRNKVIAKKRREKWNNVGKDVVVLHAINRGKRCPHLSPFVLKVETFMRMAGIEYVLDSEVPFGPNGKMPWITLNGENIADSEFILQHLKKVFKKDLSSELSEEQLGICRAFQLMTDEFLLWGVVYYRFGTGMKKIGDMLYLPWYYYYMIPIVTRKALWHQGIGRHSEKEKDLLIERSIMAISVYLGNKPYFTGDQPKEIDCSLFGMLTQYLWCLPESDFASIIRRKYKNLEDYSERMRQRFYPDWERAPARYQP